MRKLRAGYICRRVASCLSRLPLRLNSVYLGWYEFNLLLNSVAFKLRLLEACIYPLHIVFNVITERFGLLLSGAERGKRITSDCGVKFLCRFQAMRKRFVG